MSDTRSKIDLHSPDAAPSGGSRPTEVEDRRPDVLDTPVEPKFADRRGAAGLLSIDAVAALAAVDHLTSDDEDPSVSVPVEDKAPAPPFGEGLVDLTDLDIAALMKLKVDELDANGGLSADELTSLDLAALMQIDVGVPNRDVAERENNLDDANIEKFVMQTGAAPGSSTEMSVDYLTSLDLEALMDVSVSGSTEDGVDLTSLSLEALMTMDAGPGTTDETATLVDVAQLDLDTLTTVDAGTGDTGGEAATSDGGGSIDSSGFAGTSDSSTTSGVQIASTDKSFAPAGTTGTSTGSSGGAVKTGGTAPSAPANSPVGAVSDSDGSADAASESSMIGATAGVAALAADPDGSDTVTYSLTDDAGGRFQIDATTGAITVADPLLLDYETATSHTVTVQAASTDGSTSSRAFMIGLNDDTGEFSVSAVTDNDGAGDTVAESATIGAAVNITALATDGDGSDTVTYSLTDDAGGRFAIDTNTGVLSVADPLLLDFETATSHTVTVQATSTDATTTSQSFTINLSDDTTEFTVGGITDNDGGADLVSESALNGTTVGIAALATDGDGSDTVTYSLTDDAGGRFAIDTNTGAISVADNTLLDFETATSHTVTVQATSTDGSTSTQGFTVNLGDDTTEFSVGAITDNDGAADSVSETAANGTTVGITALATDADGTDGVTYSLTDDAGGRFQIDTNTGVISVADDLLLDFETATSHTVTVQATSTDGSTSTQALTINLADENESGVGAITDSDIAADNVSESVTNGTVVGVTAFATDPDGTDTVSYSLSNDAGGRFAINATTGVVTVADATQLDYETATSHLIEVTATSTDSSTSVQTFTVNLTDDNTEFSVTPVTDNDGGANTVGESVANGTVVGVTALASDADATDTVSYSLSNDAGGRFAINATTGVVTVADATQLDYEAATSHLIEVTATSTDSSTSVQTFTVNLSDDNTEFSVTPVADNDGGANTVGESVANGTVVGVTALATDSDGGDTVSYSLSNDAGGRFAINATTGVVTVADATQLDYETATSHLIEVTATSTDSSTSVQTFTVNLSDDDTEFSVTPVTDNDGGANTVGESVANGTVVGVTALATDSDGGDTVSYSLSNDAGGRFAINATTGVVTVADATQLDYETATSHLIEVTATSTDSSTSVQTFTVNLSDDNTEFSVTPVADNDGGANTVGESVTNGTVVGVTALASDADGTDTVSYSLSNDAGGRFAINATTGVVTVADATQLDYETATSHLIEVTATSTDSSTSVQTFTVNLTDDNTEFSVSAISDNDGGANAVSESASNGTAVGITALATDGDGTDSVTYGLTDDAGGRFAIDTNTGVISVADNSLLDYETATSHTVTVEATSTDGSTQAQGFTINLTDANEAPTDLTLAVNSGIKLNTGGGNNAYLQTANGGAVVGGLSQLTIEVEFSTSNPNGGEVPLFSYHVGGASDEIELGFNDTGSGIELYVEIGEQPHSVAGYDASWLLDGGDHHVALTWDNASGDWQIFADGTLVANGTGLATGHTIAAGGTIVLGQEQDSLGGGFQTTQVFEGTLYDVRVFNDVRTSTEINNNLFSQVAASEPGLVADWRMDDLSGGVTTDSAGGNDLTAGNVTGGGWVASTPALIAAVPENAPDGRLVGSVAVVDPDAGDTFTYALTDDAGGRFAIDASTGEITVADGSLLDYETSTSHNVTVQVTDGGGLTYAEAFTINLSDAVDPMSGTAGDDVLVGTTGEDTIDGLGGDDTISGLAGNDILDGGAGADTINGGDGDDILTGGAGGGGGGYDSSVTGLGAVAYWRFDETSGTSADDLVGANDGLIRSNITLANAGINGSSNAFDLNGNNSSNGNGFVEVAHANDFLLAQGTVQLWFNADTVSGTYYLLEKSDGNGATEKFRVYIDNGEIKFGMINNYSSQTVASGTTVTASTWHHVAVTFGDGDMRIYIDGQLANSAASTKDLTANTEELWIGARADGSWNENHFQGQIDEVAFHNQVLTQPEIDGLYTDGPTDGGGGGDVLDGGTGSDTASYADSASAVTVDLGAGTGTGGDADGDTLTNIENVVGSANDDTLTGDANDNVLTGGAGADALDGGAGNDTVSYAIGSGNSVTVDLSAGTGSGGDAQGDIFTGIENIVGSNNDDVLTGDANANVIDGGAGNDTIEGLGGGDTLTGGTGNDTFVYTGAGTDSDTITDFTQGGDKIDVSSYGITDINDLTIVDDGFGNAMVFLPSGDDVTLTGVAPVDLTDSDFIF